MLLPEPGDELAAEDGGQDPLRQEKAPRRRVDPAAVIGREAAGGNDAVDVSVFLQALIPGVQDREEADLYRTNGDGVAATAAGLAARPFAPTPERPAIGSNIVAPPFDEVATLGVEGLNKSAIALVKRIAWNTVDR